MRHGFDSGGETADCVIIGGGIIGCALAYYLMKQNFKKVIVCERNSICSGNTSLAAALLTRPREKTCIIPLVQETYRSIDILEDELGDNLMVRRVGSLHIASSVQTSNMLSELMIIAGRYNLEHQWLDGNDVEKEISWISGNEILKAAFVPGDAYMDPSLLGGAYYKMAVNSGAKIIQRCSVNSIISSGNGVISGVETSSGRISAPVVIDSAGVWAVMIALGAGAVIPSVPVRSNYWITAPCEKIKSSDPIVIIPDARAYARPDINSLLFGIRGKSSKYFSPAVLPDDIHGFPLDTVDEQWDMLIDGIPSLQRIIPILGSIQIAGYYAGLSAYTPDGLFIIGELPGFSGFFAVTGFSGAGIASAGGAARAAAELISGRDTFCSIEEFSPGRFCDADPLDENFMKLCAEARSGKISG